MRANIYEELIARAVAAQQRAYAPYSQFRVGAALETKAGKIYTGCNIEISSYGLTICAERVAMFKAISEGETEFKQIAVKSDTDDFCSPCGACRQVLFDFAPDLTVVLVNADNATQETSMRHLLPDAFTKRFLHTEKKKDKPK